jgi:hypothetical protein
MPLPIFNKKCLILKQPAKAGWSYVVLSNIDPKYKKGGLIRVKGKIDSYVMKQFNLLPMKDGHMMLPLNATVRKSINKQEGDRVQITLYLDHSKVEIPEEILITLLDSPKANTFFQSLSDSNKKYYIDWVLASKRVETKIQRLAKMISLLEKKKKFWDWHTLEE